MMRVVRLRGERRDAWVVTPSTDKQIAAGSLVALAWALDMGDGIYFVGGSNGRAEMIGDERLAWRRAVDFARGWSVLEEPEPVEPMTGELADWYATQWAMSNGLDVVLADGTHFYGAEDVT